MATGLPPFPAFDAENQENLAARWQRWFVRFENLMVALDFKMTNVREHCFYITWVKAPLIYLKPLQILEQPTTTRKPVMP